MNTNCVKLDIIDPEIRSVAILHDLCFSCYMLLVDQISFTDCLLLQILCNMCFAIVC